MSSYISSNANRFYTALEGGYGQVGAITAANRIPAIKLGIKQQVEARERRDKTGSRTYSGLPAGGRRKTTFDLKTYLTNWDKASASEPGYGPLFRSALGGTPLEFAGGSASAGSGTTLTFSSPHGLTAGQAVTHGGEIRFASAIVNPTTVLLNAPFSTAPGSGAAIGRTMTLSPATELPSLSIFDYWSPASAIHRVLYGAAVDKMEIKVNGDFHEVSFSGVAQNLVDSSSYSGEIAQFENFPPEPELESSEYSVVPGNMGQVWLGSSPNRFLTLTAATITLDNNLDTRAKEFGSTMPRSICPGRRKVTVGFDLFSQTDDATASLYQAAKQESPIEAMFQLGEVEGQIVGVYLKSVIPEVPEFDDSENRLQWHFRDSRAQGTTDDEITVAFA